MGPAPAGRRPSPRGRAVRRRTPGSRGPSGAIIPARTAGARAGNPNPAGRCPKPSEATRRIEQHAAPPRSRRRALHNLQEQPMPRRSIDIGGARLDAVVEGAGPVTVVFENGLATALESWEAVAPVLAERARTVGYDRRRATHAGERMAARTAHDMAADLRTLLSALAVGPPYVLVGHSWGGVVARTFIHAYPADVAGLVL